jgi:hypothetical protein
VSLVDRDFAAIRRALLNLIRIRFPNEWKDFETSGIGMAILEVVAYSHAQIGYYVDAHANEQFLVTARTFAGMRRNTAALNYRMRTATSAGVALTAFPQPPQPAKIRIPAGTTLRAKNGTVWKIAEEAIIPENSALYPDAATGTTDVILASEGEPKTATFVSDGSDFQTFLLSEQNVVEGSISMSVDSKEWFQADSLVFSEGFGFAVDRAVADGSSGFTYTLTRLYPRVDNFVVSLGTDPATAVTWEQVDDFTGSGPNDEHYVLSVDPTLGTANVIFGDGVNGKIPPVDSFLVFTYNIIGPQERYILVLEPDGLISARTGDGNGAVVPPLNAEVALTYKVGGGFRGNIDIGGIDTDIQGRLLTTDAPVVVRMQNQEAGAGAEEAETVDHARLYAPKVASSTFRASSQDDYDGLLNSFVHPDYGALAFGKADLHSDFPESNQVDLVLWSRDTEGKPVPSPETFREIVVVYMDSRADICHYLRHKGGDTVYVDISADIAIKSNLDVAAILSTVRASLENYFFSTQVLPGVDVHRSQLTTVMQSILGVSYTEITRISLSRRSRFVYFTGDGVKVRFQTETFFGYDADLGAPVVPGTFQMLVNDESVTDDLQGNLTGDVDASGINSLTYADVFQERSDAFVGTAGPRFYTPYFAYRRVVISETPVTAITSFVLPDSDVATIPGTLVVTDGVLYAYDDGVAVPGTQFEGDVVAPPSGSIVDDGSGQAEITLTFASVPTGPIVAYYVAAIPSVAFDGNVTPAPTVDQQQVASLDQPVRPSTAIIRHSQDLVVDDGLGAFGWGQNDTDTRDNANKVLYDDEVVEGEDISIWEVPLSGSLQYRGRMRDVPLVQGLSPQVRPGHAIISDGVVEITDDGQGVLGGAAIDGTGVNRIFYEDTPLSGEVIAPSGLSVYTNVSILLNIKRPPVHGAVAPYFEVVAEYQDPGDSQLYTVLMRDSSGTGVLVPSGTPGPSGPAFVSGSVDYVNGLVNISLNWPTTKALSASFTVMGGTFEFLLVAAFTGSPTIKYRKALGGQFDATFLGTNANQPLASRWDQALGGNFDVTLANTPGVGDLVQMDFRFQYELVVGSEMLLTVVSSSLKQVTGQLDSRQVKKGSLIIRATDYTGQEMTARDDGGGNFVGADVASTADVKNFVDYATGAFDMSFVRNLLAGSQVTAQYVSYLEPDEVIPILDDQIAVLATADLTHIEPVDIR